MIFLLFLLFKVQDWEAVWMCNWFIFNMTNMQPGRWEAASDRGSCACPVLSAVCTSHVCSSGAWNASLGGSGRSTHSECVCTSVCVCVFTSSGFVLFITAKTEFYCFWNIKPWNIFLNFLSWGLPTWVASEALSVLGSSRHSGPLWVEWREKRGHSWVGITILIV